MITGRDESRSKRPGSTAGCNNKMHGTPGPPTWMPHVSPCRITITEKYKGLTRATTLQMENKELV